MKVRRSKKKLVTCGLALMALPLLVGFKVDGTENNSAENVSGVVEEKISDTEEKNSQEVGRITDAGGNAP